MPLLLARSPTSVDRGVGMTLDEVLDTYGAAWDENDADARRALLERSWADDGTYCDPTARVTGREELVAHIGGTREVFGDYRLQRTSAYEAHHEFVRFTWTMVGADGATVVDGFDVVQMAPDGRVALVVGFFGPYPPRD